MSRIKIRLLLVWGVIALLALRELLGMPGELQRIEEHARRQLTTVGHAGLQVFNTTLGSAAQMLNATAEAISSRIPASGKLNPSSLNVMLERHQRMVPGIDGLGVFDAEGNILASAVHAPTTINIADRAYFRTLRSINGPALAKKPVLSQTLISRLTGKPALQIARRIDDSDGNFAGVVVASLDVEGYLGKMVNEIQATPTMRFALFDENLRVLATVPHQPDVIGQHVPQLRMFSPAEEHSLYELEGTDGMTRLGMKLTLDAFPVTLGITERKELILSAWKDSRNKSILFLIVLFTAGGLLTLGILRDEENQAQARLSQSVFSHVPEGILITDTEGRILDANPAMSELTGYAHDELIGQRTSILQSGRHDKNFYRTLWESLQHKDLWVGELWNRRKQGALYLQHARISAVRDSRGHLTQYIALCSDVTEQNARTETLEAMINRDALTGLPNRSLLDDRLQHSLALARREHRMLAVCFIDLDGFKPINDTYGHQAGDQVLIEVANRLRNSIRGGDTAARLGGDEFVLILTNLTDADECRQGIERLLNAITESIVTESGRVQVSASIGLALFPRDGQNGDELMLLADQAMYEAKRAGRNRFSEYAG